MRCRLRFAVPMALLVAVPCFPQAANESFDPSAVRMLAPNSSFVFGLQWRRALNTTVGEQLKKQFTSGPSGMPAIPGLAGLQKALVEDVDALYLASSRDLSTVGKDTPMLAVVKGRFGSENIKGLLQGKTEIYRRVALITPDGVKPPTTRVALLDENTLLFGDRREMMAALDRLAAPPAKPAASRLIERAFALAARHDLWLIADLPPGARAKPPASAAQTPGEQMFSHVSGLELGLTFSAGFDLQASLRTRSAQDTQQIASTIQGLLAVAAMSKDNTPETLDLLRKVHVIQQPRAVDLSLTLSQAEVQLLVAQAEAAKKKGPAASSSVSTSAAAPTRSEPARRGNIRIIGADSGPAEVPAGK